MSVVFEVSIVLGEEFLEGFFVSLIGAGLIYLVGLGVLGCMEEVNFLLKCYNLCRYILGIVVTTNVGGSRSLRYYRVFILLSQLTI